MGFALLQKHPGCFKAKAGQLTRLVVCSNLKYSGLMFLSARKGGGHGF